MQPSLEERGEQDLVGFFFHTLEWEAARSILGGRAGVRKDLIMSSVLLLRKLPRGDVYFLPMTLSQGDFSLRFKLFTDPKMQDLPECKWGEWSLRINMCWFKFMKLQSVDLAALEWDEVEPKCAKWSFSKASAVWSQTFLMRVLLTHFLLTKVFGPWLQYGRIIMLIKSHLTFVSHATLNNTVSYPLLYLILEAIQWTRKITAAWD